MTTIFDKFRMTGKTAVVTGGIGLLGKEFCRALAQAGADVIVADLNAAGAEETAAELRGEGGKAQGCGVDVTDKASVDRMTGFALEKTGRLDVLVCSAALDPKFDRTQGKHLNDFESYPLKMWQVFPKILPFRLFFLLRFFFAFRPFYRRLHLLLRSLHRPLFYSF